MSAAAAIATTARVAAGRLVMVDIPGRTLAAGTADFLRRRQLRGVCLFRKNLGDEALCRRGWARALCTPDGARPPARSDALRVVTQESVASDGVSEDGLAAACDF